MKSLTKVLRQKYVWFKELGPLLYKSIKSRKDLKIRINNLKKIKGKDIILFCTIKNEKHRLPFFLDYYRKLGINHFIFVDNGSTDQTIDLLTDQKDVSCYYTNASYKDSNFGMYWLNYLLLVHGRGHWCFTCDPDELFVYPFMEDRNLNDLTEYLSSLNEDSMFTVMVDMYSDKPVEKTVYIEGENPLSVCSYFDSVGYSKFYYKKYRNTFVQGGVRRRVFAKEKPEKAPALNKVPLIKWRWNYQYIESMHMVLPRRLNSGCYPTKTSGALLHFKFISQLQDKVEEELEAKQHFNDSAEYKQYGQVIKEKSLLFRDDISIKYEKWDTLEKLGLINKGEW